MGLGGARPRSGAGRFADLPLFEERRLGHADHGLVPEEDQEDERNPLDLQRGLPGRLRRRTLDDRRPDHRVVEARRVHHPALDLGEPPGQRRPVPGHRPRDLRAARAAARRAPVISAALRRVEDGRFLAGTGQFVADLSFPGELHCVFVRSPRAHARIRSIRASGLVLTGKDLEGIQAMRCGWVLPGMNEPPRWQLAREVVRHVGEPVAMVLAESRAAAEDAAEQVVVDYEPLPLIDGERAFAWTRGDRNATEQAMARASRKVELELVNNRLCGAAIETRGAASTGDTLHVGTQAPHHIRRYVCEELGIPEADLRVVSRDVGGGFGYKGKHYPEETL